jgi:hypothetical protein
MGVCLFFAMGWSIVTTFSAGELSISREDHSYEAPMPLPPIAIKNNSNSFQSLEDTFSPRVLDCIIYDGMYFTKNCTDITHRLHTCFIPLIGKGDDFIDADNEFLSQFMCLNDPGDPEIIADPDRNTIMIEGWFGSPRYRYVDFELRYEGNSTFEAIQELQLSGKTWGTSLAVYDHGVDTHVPQWRSWYYNFGPYLETNLECFFDHVTKREIAGHGFESLFGTDITEREAYTNYATNYARHSGVDLTVFEEFDQSTGTTSTTPFFIQFFFRSSLREQAVTVRPPTVLSMLEDAGGLWSALVGGVGVPHEKLGLRRKLMSLHLFDVGGDDEGEEGRDSEEESDDEEDSEEDSEEEDSEEEDSDEEDSDEDDD